MSIADNEVFVHKKNGKQEFKSSLPIDLLFKQKMIYHFVNI